jgi:hypothetical protein
MSVGDDLILLGGTFLVNVSFQGMSHLRLTSGVSRGQYADGGGDHVRVEVSAL